MIGEFHAYCQAVTVFKNTGLRMQEVHTLHVPSNAVSNILANCRIYLGGGVDLVLSAAGAALHSLLLSSLPSTTSPSPTSSSPALQSVSMPSDFNQSHIQSLHAWTESTFLYLSLATMPRRSTKDTSNAQQAPVFTLKLFRIEISSILASGLSLTRPEVKLLLNSKLGYIPYGLYSLPPPPPSPSPLNPAPATSSLHSIPNGNAAPLLVVAGMDSMIHCYSRRVVGDDWQESEVPWPEWRSPGIRSDYKLLEAFQYNLS